MTPSSTRPPPDSGARHKAVLYCPECGHESPVDGDWHIERKGRERITYICPDCGRIITTRPARLVSA